jgi:predicted phage terminase large subunit-like protein
LLLRNLTEIGAEKCARDFSLFVKTAWPLIEPKRPLQWNWHHDVICDHLEAASRREITRLLINVPFRMTKSILVSVAFPVWCWINDPVLQFLTGSHTEGLAIRDALASRQLIESPWFQARWGERVKLAPDQNTKTRYDLVAKGRRITFGMNTGVTGDGGDMLTIDDPHSAKEGMWSEANRAHVRNVYDHELSTRLNDPINSVIIVIMQRLHEQDLSGHVLAEQGWTHLCLPMEFEEDKRCRTTVRPRRLLGEVDAAGTYLQDPRKTTGELLQPDRFPAETLVKLKATLGPYGYAGQCQQHPSPPGGGILKADWWQRWETLPPRFDMVIVSVDATFKETTSGSFVVMQLWGTSGPRRYLIGQVRERMDFLATLNKLIEFVAEAGRRVDAIVIEEKANGAAIISMLQTQFPNVVPYDPKRDSKEARASAAAPQIANGNVFIPLSAMAPWVDDFVLECANFPRGTNDQVDTMSQALLYLLENMPEAAIEFDPRELMRGVTTGAPGDLFDYPGDDDDEEAAA